MRRKRREGVIVSDCRKRHCEYCGLTPCVGDRCPQWADDDDEDEDDGAWSNPDA